VFLRKKGRTKNLLIGVTGPVRRGCSSLILQTEPRLGFRRGAGGWCVGTNESMGNAWLGRCPYLFAQGTCSNGRASHHLDCCYWES
jgi:hypothetical protein